MTEQTTNNALLLAMPDSPANMEPPEELYRLLSERIARYTMGDSASVPADTARRILESILYCLDLHRRFSAADAPGVSSLAERWQAGVREAKRIAKRAKLLLLQAQRTPPPLTNIAYCDTMDALPSFFAAYDADFFAQEIPCSFDYPLSHPVSETLLGAEYMQDFLRRLLAESSLLRAFSSEAISALYARYYIDYADLLVNLFLPAAEMATLCALAGEDARALSLSSAGMAQVSRALSQAEENEAQAMMRDAAARALEERGLRGDFLRDYMQKTALDLLVRLRAVNIAEKNE